MNTNNGLVSIITPNFNNAKYIEDTIESVINQTYDNWELIIVDDNSTDNSVEIIKMYMKKEQKISLIELKENMGAAHARNHGLSISKGRYIAFLDSDDVWLKEKLSIQLRYMEKMNIGFSFTSYELLNDSHKKISVPYKLNYKRALTNTAIGCLTVVIDKNIIGDFKMPLVRKGQDHLTWLNILKQGHDAYGIDIVLAKYRLVSGSLSNNKFKAIKRQWHNYRYELKFGLLKSSYYFFVYSFYNVKKYYLTK